MQETWVQSESGRSRGGGHVSPLQSSYLENPMDRGAWGASAHGVTELDTWSDRAQPSTWGRTHRNRSSGFYLSKTFSTPHSHLSSQQVAPNPWVKLDRELRAVVTEQAKFYRLFAERPAFAHAPIWPHGSVSAALNGTFPLHIQNFPPRKLLPSSFHNTKVLSL